MIQQIDKCEDCSACCRSTDEIYLTDEEKLIPLYDITVTLEGCSLLSKKTNRCTIYKDRPWGCREFKCYYIYSDLSKDYLPERVGFMVQIRPKELLLVTPVAPWKIKVTEFQNWVNNHREKIMTMHKEAERTEEVSLALFLHTPYGDSRLL